MNYYLVVDGFANITPRKGGKNLQELNLRNVKMAHDQNRLSVRGHTHIHRYIHTHTHAYIHIQSREISLLTERDREDKSIERHV